MKVLVCGSRDWEPHSWIIATVLEGILQRCIQNFEVMEVIEGGARGADANARDFYSLGCVFDRNGGAHAKHSHVIHRSPYYADWDRYGKSAGYIRNREMLQALTENGTGGTMCVGFFKIGAANKGTRMMVDLCREAKVPTIEVWG